MTTRWFDLLNIHQPKMSFPAGLDQDSVQRFLKSVSVDNSPASEFAGYVGLRSQARASGEEEHPFIVRLNEGRVGGGGLAMRNDPLDPCAGAGEDVFEDLGLRCVGEIGQEVRHVQFGQPPITRSR